MSVKRGKNRLYLKLAAVSVLLVVSVIWFGCSKTPTAPDTSGKVASAALVEYFPLNSGDVFDYQIINHSTGDTTYQRYVVGGQIDVGGSEIVYPWLGYIPGYSLVADTGFICFDGNVLAYYDNLYSYPEVILQTPFEVGKNWKRYSSSKRLMDSATILNLGYGNDENNNNNGIPGDGYDPYGGGDNGGSAKTYPTYGDNKFIITAIEDLNLGDLGNYKNCLKVINSTTVSSNQYWYAPKVGLVRYAIAVDSVSYPTGMIIGTRIASAP
jgi:hypothetical protein